jgi:heat shock protein HslJ
MKSRYLILVIAVLVLLTGVFYLKNSQKVPANTVTEDSHEIPYKNDKYHISFSYPDTYALTETDTVASGNRAHHNIALVPKKDLPVPENGEYPPAITFDFYDNSTAKDTTESWIKNSKESNFKLAEGNITDTKASGMPASSFRWLGLYQGTTIAMAMPDYVYVFSVTYLEMGAPIIQDFAKIRESINITNEAGSANTSLMGKSFTWVSTTYSDGKIIKPKTVKKFVLTFDTDKSFSATTDCNSMGGEYIVTENQITFSKMMATQMYCAGSIEGDFTKMLGQTQSYFFQSNGNLVFDLKFDSGSSIFTPNLN